MPLRDTIHPLVLLITILILAAFAGVLATMAPIMTAVLGAAIIGMVGLGLFIRSMGSKLADSNSTILPLTAITLIFLSLVRIADRDPTSSALGTQAIFEFSLQGIALGLLALGVAFGSIRIKLSGAAMLWAALGVFAVVTAFWAPQPQLTFLKGAQLLMVTMSVAVAASQFRDRYQSVRFLTWLTTLVVLVGMVIQVASYGPDSLLVLVSDGRTRLNLLSIHPIILGTLSGAMALLMLVQRPRGIDWLPIPLLLVVTLLTAARAPLGILLITILLYAILRSRINVRSYLGWAAVGIVICAIAFVGLPMFSGDPSSASSTTLGDLERDITTLNGRIPIWQAVLTRASATSDQQFSVLIGHGYASFRFFGLDLFMYGGDAHNSVIQIFAELGVVGTTLWILAVGACFRRVWTSADSLRQSMIAILPLVYILATQMMDASLADSRSFLLVIIIFYAHAALQPQDAPATERSSTFPAHVPHPARRLTANPHA